LQLAGDIPLGFLEIIDGGALEVGAPDVLDGVASGSRWRLALNSPSHVPSA
jgi:hypothetical protein